jgi:energy-coupling factor transporter transmembrane protein EcfT
MTPTPHHLLDLHPATRIAVWLVFAAAVSWASVSELPVLTLPVAGWILWRRDSNFLPMLRRARWLFLSLLLIYGLTTPGGGLLPWEAGPNLSRQGLVLGIVQAWRIALMIGALALLLRCTAPAQLIAGLHALLYPLQRALRIDAGRIALRLFLTLQYASATRADMRNDWRAALKAAAGAADCGETRVVIERAPFSWRDGTALAAVLVLVLGLV